MTKWTDDGRPAVWVTETEPEFDPAERDSWYAFLEHEAAICPHCGNYRVICSTPDGLSGDGYHVRQEVCYVTMIRDRTRRRIDRKFAKTNPDLQGFLPTDGVTFAVGLAKDDSEDILGLEAAEDSLERLFAGELDADDADAHDRREHGQDDEEPGEAARR